MSFLRLPGVLLLAMLLAMPAVAAGLPEGCAAPVDLTRLRSTLPRTADRIAARAPLTIVAIGSSSTQGVGASGPGATYPSRLAEELRRQLPLQPIAITNRGVGGETAIDMLKRFDRDILPLQPDLVIWQVGTNSVLRDAAVEPYLDAVRDGVTRLRAAGIDVIIMDAQYAPMLLQHPTYREMERGLAQLGKEEGVPVFRRFALMRHWIQAEQLDFAQLLTPDNLHLNDLGYRCVGTVLADAIVDTLTPTALAMRR